MAFLRELAQRLLPLVVPVGLMVFWQIASALGWLSTRVLPAPLEVLKAGWALSASGERTVPMHKGLRLESKKRVRVHRVRFCVRGS